LFDDWLANLKPRGNTARFLNKYLKMNDNYKALSIFLSGFLTILLMQCIPIAGGGMSIVFIITVPMLIGLGLILGLIYHFGIRKMSNIKLKKIIYAVFLVLIIGMSFSLYPYRL